MIHPKELRIGNLFMCEDGIEQIEEINRVYVHAASAEVYYTSNINPISLTKEWLERFGFKKDAPNEENDVLWYKGIIELYQPEGVPEFNYATRLKNGCFKSGFVVRHVHQLQNLYFALTGEELEVKEYETR